MTPTPIRPTIALLALGFFAQTPARAQEHAQDIVTVVAEDAFGTSFGVQSVGLFPRRMRAGLTHSKPAIFASKDFISIKNPPTSDRA